MIPRRRLVHGALVLSVLGGAYLLFGSSEERKVLAAVKQLAGAANARAGASPAELERRTAATLGKLLSDTATLSVPELPVVEGREAIAELFLQGHAIMLRVEIEQSDVRVGPGSHARADLLVDFRARPTGEERQQRRDVRVELERRGSDYVVRRIDVGPAGKEEPEARP